jgi:outer membrane protein OmpA-like peptidoglycan-associated protein
VLGVTLAPAAAQAQFLERLSLSAHLGGGTILSAPQSNEFGFGGALELRGGVRIAGPLRVHLMFSTAFWPVTEQGATDSVGTATLFGGGLRVDPILSRSFGGPFVDVDAAFTATGADAAARFGYMLGAGWVFPITGILSLGPAVRFGQVIGSDTDDLQGRGTATFWRAGLEITLRAPPDAPPPPVTETAPARPADADNDGVTGPDDQCPAEPETRNGYMDEDGCPDEPDPDHDNIRGLADQCPAQPETVNGHQDDDGCPDTVPMAPDVASPTPSVPVEATPAPAAFAITQVLTYEPRRDRVERDMRATLDAVAQLLRDHPEVRRIRIEGHADDNGNPNRDLRLSRKRAQNVQRYLNRAHIERDRVTIDGVGANRACASGGHRCVDFIVVESGPPGAASAAPAAPAEEGGRHGRRRRRHH